MLDNWAQTFSTRRFNTRLACLLKLCEFIGEATNGPLYIIDFLLRKTKDRRTFLFTLPKIYFHKFPKKQLKNFPKCIFTNLQIFLNLWVHVVCRASEGEIFEAFAFYSKTRQILETFYFKTAQMLKFSPFKTPQEFYTQTPNTSVGEI